MSNIIDHLTFIESYCNCTIFLGRSKDPLQWFCAILSSELLRLFSDFFGYVSRDFKIGFGDLVPRALGTKNGSSADQKSIMASKKSPFSRTEIQTEIKKQGEIIRQLKREEQTDEVKNKVTPKLFL